MREMLDALNPQQRRPQAVHPQRTGFCRQKMRRTGDDEAVGVWRVVGEGRMGGRVWVWGGWGRLEGGGRGEESGSGGGCVQRGRGLRRSRLDRCVQCGQCVPITGRFTSGRDCPWALGGPHATVTTTTRRSYSPALAQQEREEGRTAGGQQHQTVDNL